MELPQSDITFHDGKIMLRKKSVVNASDASPEYVYDFVTDNAIRIYAQMHELMDSVDPHTEKRRDVLRPAIMIARLSLLHARDEVFTQRGLDQPSLIHTSVDDLTLEFTPYWRMLTQSDFVPEVQEIRHNSHTTTDLTGVWLGVRADPSNNIHLLNQ